MDVDYLVLADAATAADGKHYIHGGGWDTLWAASFPVTQPQMTAAVRLRVPWHDTNQPHQLGVDIVDADGNSLLPQRMAQAITVGRPPTLDPGDDQVVPLTFTFAGFQFPAPGTYALIVTIDGMEVGRAPFRVRALAGTQPVSA